jgi:hypothetical protein
MKNNNFCYEDRNYPNYYPLGQCNNCNPSKCNIGCRGPIGPQGIPGQETFLSGMQVQLTNLSSGSIADNERVNFNTFISTASTNISYSTVTRLFTITKTGNYYINWWVNTDGAGQQTTVKFSIVVTGGQTISATSISPLTTLQLNGNALISVTNPATFALVNESGVTVNFGLTEIQADLTILEVTS